MISKEAKKAVVKLTKIKVEDAEIEEESITECEENEEKDIEISNEEEEEHDESNDELLDEDFEDGILDDDSVSAEEVTMLHEKIDSLQHQNEVNTHRLHTLELDDERMRKELHDKEKLIKKYELENQELKRELAVKKKFVFSMQQLL